MMTCSKSVRIGDAIPIADNEVSKNLVGALHRKVNQNLLLVQHSGAVARSGRKCRLCSLRLRRKNRYKKGSRRL